MSSVPDVLKSVGDLLAVTQSSPLLLFSLVVVAAFAVVAMALVVVHAAVTKK